MEIYSRFFRVDSGPLVERTAELLKLRSESILQLARIGAKAGAEDARVWSESGEFAGLTFAGFPCSTTFRQLKNHGLWVPRKNTTAGKRLWEEIATVPVVPGVQDALHLVGLYPHRPALVSDRRGYWPSLGGLADKGIWFVRVPWRTAAPDELEAYQRGKALGMHYCADLEHLLWTPPAEMREVKEWEYLKEWEELTGAPPAAGGAR